MQTLIRHETFNPLRIMIPIRRLVSLVLLATANMALATGDIPNEPLARQSPASWCNEIEVPAGNRVSARLYAQGVQIYRWNGSAWTFVAPEAGLFADPHLHGAVGFHDAGPTWEAADGSRVVAARLAGCTPDPDSIPWLLLQATATTGHGRFGSVTFIQRIHTQGGLAPEVAGSVIGEEARVPYVAEYVFYRRSRE